jgi:putative addiction module killer protein
MQYTIKTTSTYDTWFKKLKDTSGKIRILARLDRVALGNFGDTKPIDNTIAELRLFFGGGYRIYYLVDGDNIILLLNGGNKSSQNNDIEKAKSILKALQKERP